MDDYNLFDDERMLRNFAVERHKIICANCVAFFRDLEAHANLLERVGLISDPHGEPIAEYATGTLEWVRDMQERLNKRD